MSDLPTSDDELVSAYLDGEATADERALVESRPDLLARVEQLRRVAQQVSAVASAPAAAREAAMGAALAAFEVDASGAAPASVVGLASARTRRRSRVLVVGLGAAAALVLTVAVGVAVLRPKSSVTATGSEAVAAGPKAAPTSSANDQPSPLSAESGRPAAGADQNDSTRTSTTPAPASAGAGSSVYAGALGSFPDQAALGRQLRPRLTAQGIQPPATPAFGSGQQLQPLISVSSCDATYRSTDSTVGQPVLTGEATVDGQPVLVIVYAVPGAPTVGGSYKLVTFTPDCTVVASQPI